MGAVRGWALSARRAQRSRGTERSVSLPSVEKKLKRTSPKPFMEKKEFSKLE